MTPTAISLYNLKQKIVYAAKTGHFLDIQEIGKNKKTIVHPVDLTRKEIHKGVLMETYPLMMEDGNFSNVYDLSFDSSDPSLTPIIHSEKRPYYLLDYFENNSDLVAIMNGSFFFLTDIVVREPKDYPFHFCLRDGKVIGLPSGDEPILYTKDGKIYARPITARGTMTIAGKIVSWVGAQSAFRKKTGPAILYNSASAKIIKSFDPKTGVRMGVLDDDNIHTPVSKKYFDLIVDLDNNDRLRISKITEGGGTHFFDGHFILQFHGKNTFKIGDEVLPLMLDDLNLKKKTSGISIHKSVHDPYFYTPDRISSRDARSVIAQDRAGWVHFVVFDGSKYIPKFKGVSAADIKDHFSEDKYEWSFFLDGGSSSRIITRNGRDMDFFANEFAFRKVTNSLFMWDWKRHRKLASSVALKMNRF